MQKTGNTEWSGFFLETCSIGCPQGSVLEPLLFLIFINDFPNKLFVILNLFADDVPLNLVMFDNEQATEHLNSHLKLIHEWSLKWKIIFNPGANKPAAEITFTNRNVTPDDTITFDNAGVKLVDSHKQLGLILDSKLTFNKHLDEKIAKENRNWNYTQFILLSSKERPYTNL